MMMMLELFILMILIIVTLSATGSVITVDNVPVQQGTSIIIPCFYNAQHANEPKYLCFGNLWNFCKNVTEINPGKVSISDDQTQHIFTVTIKNVTTSDSGLYWCSVKMHGFDKKKDFKLNVREATPELYVDHQMVTGYEGGHVVISCHGTMKPQKWCKIDGACVNTIGNISGALVQLSSMDRGFRVTMSELTMASTGWYWCSAGDKQMPVHITVQEKQPGRMSFAWLIILGLLLLLTFMAVIVFMQHKRKCVTFSVHKMCENTYVTMKKPNLQTKQNEEGENNETQDYEIMSRPEQALKVQAWKHEDNKSPKKYGGPGHKDILEDPYCAC